MSDSLLEGFEDYRITLEPGEYLFREGAEADCFYIIQEGLADVIKEGNQETFIASLGPRKLVGEMALLDEELNRSATVRARTEIECVQFGKHQFEELLESNKKFRQLIIKVLVKRLQETTTKMAQLKEDRKLGYESAFVLLKYLSECGWNGRETIEQRIDPSIPNLVDGFDLSPELIEQLLSAPTYEKLELKSPQTQEKLRAAAWSILETGLDHVEFNTEYSDQDQAEQQVGETDYSDLETAVQVAKELYFRLRKASGKEISPKKLDRVREEYAQLRERLDRALDNSEADLYVRRRLDAYVRSLGRAYRKLAEA